MLGLLYLIRNGFAKGKDFADRTSYAAHSYNNAVQNDQKYFSDGRGHMYDRKTGHQIIFGGYKNGCKGILDVNTNELIENWTKNKYEKEIEDYIRENTFLIKKALYKRKKCLANGENQYCFYGYIFERKYNHNYKKYYEICYQRFDSYQEEINEQVFDFSIGNNIQKKYNNSLLYDDYFNLPGVKGHKEHQIMECYINLTKYTMEELFEYAEWVGAPFDRLNAEEIHEYRYNRG